MWKKGKIAHIMEVYPQSGTESDCYGIGTLIRYSKIVKKRLISRFKK